MPSHSSLGYRPPAPEAIQPALTPVPLTQKVVSSLGASHKVIGQISKYAPNLKDAIMGRVVFTPLHYENMFGITGGDYCHGVMQPGQMFDFRPVVGWSSYKTPVENLG